jgi:hypothetical protein
VINASLLATYLAQFDDLKLVVSESTLRVVAEPADPLFYDNQNVFIKSYLVSACSVLEAFIQDLAESYMNVLQERLNTANLPYNLVTWIAEFDKAKLNFATFQGSKTKKDISDLISPNYFKTIKAFQRIGVDIGTSEIQSYKDYVSSIVEKRNKIVHHNDSASDLSFADITAAIDEFKQYVRCLYDAVMADPHLHEKAVLPAPT